MSMLIAFILMNLTKIPANLLSLGAIDFGIIVNAPIIVVEAVLRRREAKPREPLSEQDALQAVLQIARPMFFATLIIITAYFPLFALQRVEAKLFLPMAYAVSYSVFGALVFSLTVIPALAYLAYRKPYRVFHNPALEWLERRYQGALRWCLYRLKIIYGLAVAAMVAVLFL